MQNGTLDRHLQKVSVHKGDVYYVPAGTVHGIGAGILVAEVQESSNITCRVYDYDRVDRTGKKRELHFDKAIQVMDMGRSLDAETKSRLVQYSPGCSIELLCRCKYFEAERIRLRKNMDFSVSVYSFHVLLCLDGNGTVENRDVEGDLLHLARGDCMFIPAGSGRCRLSGEMTLLKIRC